MKRGKRVTGTLRKAWLLALAAMLALLAAPAGLALSLGVIDGRNIWRADLAGILETVEPLVAKFGEDRLQIAPSCSLLHVPIDLELETGLDGELKSWLAFAIQKLDELAGQLG